MPHKMRYLWGEIGCRRAGTTRNGKKIKSDAQKRTAAMSFFKFNCPKKILTAQPVRTNGFDTNARETETNGRNTTCAAL